MVQKKVDTTGRVLRRKKSQMDNTTKINFPSVKDDLYKSVKFIKDFSESGAKEGDVGVIVYASSFPEDMFEVQLHGNTMPISVPKWGLELIKPKF